MALTDTKLNPYASIKEAERLAEEHASEARHFARRAAHMDSTNEQVARFAAIAQANAAAATATMVASGCTQIQDLKR